MEDQKELQATLNESAHQPRSHEAKKVLVAVPNMGSLNQGLVHRLFVFANDQRFKVSFFLLPGCKFHDYARNSIVRTFLEAPEKPDYLYMIDSDNVPDGKSLDLVTHDLDIVSGVALCWIKNEMRPSVWKNSECEQCRVKGVFMRDGRNHDPREYQVDGPWMFRWDPFHQVFMRWINRETKEEIGKCRCRGTGVDPFMFRVAEATKDQPLKECDSVGAANLIIRRNVIEKIDPPWFQFLYRPDRQIMLTEDHYFCWKARINGFKVWVDWSKQARHVKELDLMEMFAYSIKAFERGRDFERGIVSPSTNIEQKFPDVTPLA